MDKVELRSHPQKSPQRQADVGTCAPHLATFDPIKLLDAVMVLLNDIDILRILQSCRSLICKSLVAQYSGSPFGATPLNTLMNP